MENFLKTEIDRSVKEMLPPTLTGKFQELMADQISKQVIDSWKSNNNTEKIEEITRKSQRKSQRKIKNTPFDRFKQEIIEECNCPVDDEMLQIIKISWKELSNEEKLKYK
jgi:hypothetical protein